MAFQPWREDFFYEAWRDVNITSRWPKSWGDMPPIPKYKGFGTRTDVFRRLIYFTAEGYDFSRVIDSPKRHARPQGPSPSKAAGRGPGEYKTISGQLEFVPTDPPPPLSHWELPSKELLETLEDQTPAMRKGFGETAWWPGKRETPPPAIRTSAHGGRWDTQPDISLTEEARAIRRYADQQAGAMRKELLKQYPEAAKESGGRRKIMRALKADTPEEFELLADAVPGIKRGAGPLRHAWESLQKDLSQARASFWVGDEGARMALPSILKDDIIPDDVLELYNLLMHGKDPRRYGGAGGLSARSSLNRIQAAFWGFTKKGGQAIWRSGEAVRLDRIDLGRLAEASQSFYPDLRIRGFGRTSQVGPTVAGAVSHRRRIGLPLMFRTGASEDIVKQIQAHESRIMLGDFAMMRGKKLSQHTVAEALAALSPNAPHVTMAQKGSASATYRQLYERLDETLINPLVNKYGVDYDTALEFVGRRVLGIDARYSSALRRMGPGEVSPRNPLSYIVARMASDTEAGVRQLMAAQERAMESVAAPLFRVPSQATSFRPKGAFAGLWESLTTQAGLGRWIPEGEDWRLGSAIPGSGVGDEAWELAQAKVGFAYEEIARWLQGKESPYITKKLEGTYADLRSGRTRAKIEYSDEQIVDLLVGSKKQGITGVYEAGLFKGEGYLDDITRAYEEQGLGVPVGEGGAVRTPEELKRFLMTGETAYIVDDINEKTRVIREVGRPEGAHTSYDAIEDFAQEIAERSETQLGPSPSEQALVARGGGGSAAGPASAAAENDALALVLEDAKMLLSGELSRSNKAELERRTASSLGSPGLTPTQTRATKKKIIDRLASAMQGEMALTEESLKEALSTPFSQMSREQIEQAVISGRARLVTGAGDLPVHGYYSVGENIMLATQRGDTPLNLVFGPSAHSLATRAPEGFMYYPEMTMMSVISQSDIGEFLRSKAVDKRGHPDLESVNRMLSKLGISSESVEGIDIYQKALRSWWGPEYKTKDLALEHTVLEMLTGGFSTPEREAFVRNIQGNLGLTNDELSAILGLRGKVESKVNKVEWNLEKILSVAGASPVDQTLEPGAAPRITLWDAVEQGMGRFLGDDEPAAELMRGDTGPGDALRNIIRKIMINKRIAPKPVTATPGLEDEEFLSQLISYTTGQKPRPAQEMFRDPGGTWRQAAGRTGVVGEAMAAGREVAEEAAQVIGGAAEAAAGVASEVLTTGAESKAGSTLMSSRNVQAALAGVGALVLAGAILKQTQGPRGGTPESMPYGDSYPSSDGMMQMPLVHEMAHMPSTLVSMMGSGYTNMKPRGVMYDIRSNMPNPPDIGQFADQLSNLFETDAGVPVNVSTYSSGRGRLQSPAELDDMLARRLSR